MPPKKEPGQKYVNHQITFPPEVWEAIEVVAKENRSAWVVQACRERLERQNARRIMELEERVSRLEQHPN
jgi:hypothetical protein